MKSSVVLFIVLVLMHTMTLVHITIFNGEWGGIVLMLSNLLFLIAVFYFGTEYRARKRVKG
ncbi:hypothetical protein [Halobacillus sp. B23F22_1]|uniref:hypothetical protein n=1 Tax=Halobacillus sp. B23F22_1 TaxID=3459514 RepID=UPI00373DEF79